MPALLPHTGKSVYFSCIDDRLTEPHTTFIRALAGGAFHPQMAGGGAAILDAGDQASALKQIVAAYKINQVTDIYIESHTDCGAYRLAGVTFTGNEDELARLYADLDQATQVVQKALEEAGAPEGKCSVHTRVVDPSGQLQACSK